MVHRCVVCGTTARTHPHLSFHRFPLNPATRIQWMERVGLRGNLPPIKHPEICSLHFKAGDIIIKPSGHRYVRPGAEPVKATTQDVDDDALMPPPQFGELQPTAAQRDGDDIPPPAAPAPIDQRPTAAPTRPPPVPAPRRLRLQPTAAQRDGDDIPPPAAPAPIDQRPTAAPTRPPPVPAPRRQRAEETSEQDGAGAIAMPQLSPIATSEEIHSEPIAHSTKIRLVNTSFNDSEVAPQEQTDPKFLVMMRQSTYEEFLTFKGLRTDVTSAFNRVAIKTATIDRAKSQKRRDFETASQSDSSTLLSSNIIDLFDIADVSSGEGSIDQALKQQRELASNTLDRDSRISGNPSRLLQADLHQSKSEGNFYFPSQSTVNESDLQRISKNTSTPRSSSSETDLQKIDIPSASELKQQRSTSLSVLQAKSPANEAEPDVSLIDATLLSNVSRDISKVKDKGFSEYARSPDTSSTTSFSDNEAISIMMSQNTDRITGIPSRLLQADLHQSRSEGNFYFPSQSTVNESNLLRISKNTSTPRSSSSETDLQKIDIPSASELKQQRSNSLSVLRAKSPANEAEPDVSLIDATLLPNVSREDEGFRSLRISAVQRVLAETDDTPTKVIDYLLQYNKGTCAQRATIQSPDASSSTLFSDNEAIRTAVNEDEEYMKPSTGRRNVTRTEPTSQMESHLSVDKSISSTSYRSSSSLTSLPHGKLPIESTVGELVWGCVEVHRCVTKQFMIRNKTGKTVRLESSVSTHEFKIMEDNRSDSDYLSAFRFVLHGHESRPLNISFIPTKMGSAIDELVFAPLDPHLTQTKKQCIKLWGYGGYSNTEYRNVSMDTTGKYWLTLERMDNRMQIEQSFTIKNVGVLPAFTNIKIVPKHVATFTSSKVEPNLVVLLPNEEKTIKVTYILNARDCRILTENPVTDIGKLEILSGPEVSRGRLRRLHQKTIEKSLVVNELAKTLSKKIHGEVFPGDVKQFKERPSALPELLESLSNENIIITIKQAPNQTLVSEYQTLCGTSVGSPSVLLDDTVLSP